MHTYCMPSRAAREHEVLMKVETSSAEHGAVASASPRHGSWQQQVHLLIARRTARVRSACLAGRRHASSSNGDSYDVRVFTRAQPEGACVRGCEVLERTAPRSAPRRVTDPDLTLFVTYRQILCSYARRAAGLLCTQRTKVVPNRCRVHMYMSSCVQLYYVYDLSKTTTPTHPGRNMTPRAIGERYHAIH